MADSIGVLKHTASSHKDIDDAEEAASSSQKNSDDIELGVQSKDSESATSANGVAISQQEQSQYYHRQPANKPYSTPPFPVDPADDHTNHQYMPSFLSRPLLSFINLPIIRPIAKYIKGPPVEDCKPPRLWRIPFLERTEKQFIRYTSTRWTRSPIVLWIFLLAWFLGLTFLTRAAWYNSPNGDTEDSWLSGTSTYWQRNDGCGLDGASCGPFEGFTASYRCPNKVANTKLLNYRAIGPLEIINEPLIVGGGDDLGTYRADSFICAAAVHRGLFSNGNGGCLTLTAIGNYTNFIGSTANGFTSVSFPSEFPFAYRFNETSQKDCRDLRDDMLAFDAVMSAAFGLLLRTTSGVFYWVSVCFGYWHISLASDPRSFPPDLAGAFGTFLPCLFICYAFYRLAFRWVIPAFSNKTIERTFLFYAPYWVFLLSNYTLDKIPIDRLTASDIKQQQGGIAAVVVLSIVILVIAINQFRVMRTTGWLPYYLGWYVLGGLIVLVLSQLPGLSLRIHHYIAAMVLIPLTAFPTRASLIYQGILLGLFMNGAARWGFDSILQTPAELRRDAALGSDLPSFDTTTIDAVTQMITWTPIPESLSSSWDGFALIINDVLRYSGQSSNFSLAGLQTDIPYYLRLAYTNSGTSGDFTKAATAWLSNGTFIPPAAGPS